MATRDVDDARWRATAAPLAAALVPDARDLDPATTFALHGVLQSVPLHALPLPGESRWLGDVTAVAYRPAGLARRTPEPPREGTWLFVVDPGRTLSTGGAARFYRSVAPSSEVLEGDAATGAALERELPRARSLHLDTHAHYDPAFPELSTVDLADRRLSAAQIAARAGHLELANVSACHSASWPVTADSGRFGLAGTLARAGVRWVVASRAELDDALATDFNRAFYERLAENRGVPDAFRHALGRVRAAHPVSSWAAILLLETGTLVVSAPNEAEKKGQFSEGRTP